VRATRGPELSSSANGGRRQDRRCTAPRARRRLGVPLRRRAGPPPPPHQAHQAQLGARARARPGPGPGELQDARASARAPRLSPGPTAVVVVWERRRLPDPGRGDRARGGRRGRRVRRREGLRRGRGRRGGRHRRHQDGVGHRVRGRRRRRGARRRRVLVPRARHRLHRPVPGQRHDPGTRSPAGRPPRVGRNAGVRA